MNNDIISTHVMPKFMNTLIITLIGMILGYAFVPIPVALFISVLAFLMLIITFITRIMGSYRKKQGASSVYGIALPMNFVYGFSFLTGIGLTADLKWYVSDIGAIMVIGCILITFLMFFSMVWYARKTRKDFSNIGFFLFWALIALISFTLLSVFTHSPIFIALISFLGILIFNGYILYDISIMKNQELTVEDVPMAVLNLYLDFINLLLEVLRLVAAVVDIFDL